MKEDEVVKNANSMVENVEEPLKERRKEKLQEEAKKKAEQYEHSSGFQFLSPPIAGGNLINTSERISHNEQVRFKLSQQLPKTNTSTLHIDSPSKSEIDSNSHELNRLLQYYDLDVDELAGITGEQLPICPTSGWDSDDVSYEIDVPPIDTKLNMLKYKLRRTALRMKLIRKGRTPDTNVFGRGIEFSNSDVPVELHSHYKLFRGLYEDDVESFVPTHRGSQAILLMQILSFLALLPLIAVHLLLIIVVFAWAILVAVFSAPIIVHGLKRGFTSIKQNLMPKAE